MRKGGIVLGEMKKRDKTLGILINSKLGAMTKVELKYLKDGVTDVLIIAEKTNIAPQVIERRYGITEDKLKWLITNKARYLKRIDKHIRENPRNMGVFPVGVTVDILLENKFEVIGMLRDGAKPTDIYEELNLVPSLKALNKFKEMVKEEGYSVSKISGVS